LIDLDGGTGGQNRDDRDKKERQREGKEPCSMTLKPHTVPSFSIESRIP
jgi:hypothetical protein